MRVLLVSHTCQSRSAGQPKANILGGVPDLELQVLVPDRWRNYGRWNRADVPVTPASSQRGAVYRVSKVSLPWTGPGQWYLHWYPGLRRMLTEFRPDVIDLWEEPWGLVSAHTCWLRNRLLPNAKIVSETEQNIEKKLPFPFEFFRNYTLRNAAFAIGRSAGAVNVLRDKGFRGKSAVVPNGVDTTLFSPMDRGLCRKKFGFSNFVAGYVGRFVLEKGIMDLIEAVSRCNASVELAFVGVGPLRSDMERRVSELDLKDRVHFLAERSAGELPELMNALDVLVLPSRTTPRWKEQFGRVLVEAMSCEIPVIGSDSGAIPDVIGKCGIVFPEGDSQALADAIMTLHENPKQAAEFGKSGRDRVIQWCSWEAVATQMAGIYREVCGNN